jgi:cytochrome c-type biogenesis protein CcmE
MSSKPPIKILAAAVIILATVGWLVYTGSTSAKMTDYYVTIGELNSMGGKAYSRHLRVAGSVEPGSIQRSGPNAQFVLLEQGHTLKVNYQGSEPPPDTFKDNAQALAVGTYGRDGVFHATQVQAKCASKYAPAKPGEAPVGNTAMLAPAK